MGESETKTCEACPTIFARSAKESGERWRQRRFCSRACSNRATPGRPRLPRELYRSRYRGEEHRAVAEAKIGRRIRDDEEVHHVNEDRLDNRPENLEVLTETEHGLRHSKHPRTKTCVICDATFTPHPTKRARQQTCGRDVCKSELLSIRNRERRLLLDAA